MKHLHISKYDIERLDDYSTVELEKRLADITHRLRHIEAMHEEAMELSVEINKRLVGKIAKGET